MALPLHLQIGGDAWQLLFLLLLLFLVMSMALSTLQQREARPKEKITTYTLIACSSCDYQERREFVPGDHVGKLVRERRCPKDGGDLIIKAVYAEKQQIK